MTTLRRRKPRLPPDGTDTGTAHRGRCRPDPWLDGIGDWLAGRRLRGATWCAARRSSGRYRDRLRRPPRPRLRPPRRLARVHRRHRLRHRRGHFMPPAAAVAVRRPGAAGGGRDRCGDPIDGTVRRPSADPRRLHLGDHSSRERPRPSRVRRTEAPAPPIGRPAGQARRPRRGCRRVTARRPPTGRHTDWSAS